MNYRERKSPCLELGCDKIARSRGYCQSHYGKKLRTGELERVPRKSSVGPADRQCKDCGRGSPEVRFNGYRQRCNTCEYARVSDKRAEYHLKKLYGVTKEEFESKLETQGGGCAICGSPTPRGRIGGRFHQDHNHLTGQARGVLCAPCNLGIGHLQENPELLRLAALYLESYQEDK